MISNEHGRSSWSWCGKMKSQSVGRKPETELIQPSRIRMDAGDGAEEARGSHTLGRHDERPLRLIIRKETELDVRCHSESG